MPFKYDVVFEVMHWVKFNPDNEFEIAANGRERIIFLCWEHGKQTFEYYSGRIEKKDFTIKERKEAKLTKTVFIPGGNMAVTGTDKGDILVWD